MKLIIQIPCYNEETSLAASLRDLPRTIQGIEIVEYLVVNDGSTDNTQAVAESHGAHHIVTLPHRRGLAKAFMAGLEKAIELGADIIVNTDGDNQYCADDIQKLVHTLFENNADMVIGCRPIPEIEHFSFSKKVLHKMGNSVVRKMSGLEISDAASGFRAITRDAAFQLNVFTDFTYTLETILQAGQKGMRVVSVPVRVNSTIRPSRLMNSTLHYVIHALITLMRVSVIYRPFTIFSRMGIAFWVLGFLLCFRFMFFYLTGDGEGHIQSLILASILLGFGFQSFIVGFIADLQATNRKILENIQYQTRKKIH